MELNKSRFYWKCIHNKCSGVAFYVDSVNAHKPPPHENGDTIGGTISSPTELPENWFISFNGCASRCYPNGQMPQMKQCECFTCKELILMFPEHNTLKIEYEQPDWDEYFKRKIWYALSSLNHIIEKHADFSKVALTLSAKTKLAIHEITNLTEILKEDEYKPF